MASEVLGLLNFKGNEHVLDVGCGDGRITSRIAGRVPSGRVMGIDASRDMITFASTQHGGGHPNLQFQVADASQLPFNQQFDTIVSFNALHWIPDQAGPLQSIRRSMKPGAMAQIRLVPAGERKSLETVLEETRKLPRWAPYFSGFQNPYLHLSPSGYSTLAEQNGFRVFNVQMRDKAWDFGSRQVFFAFASVTFVEWTSHLPELDKPAFIADVLDRYQKVAADRPGEENTFKFYQMDIFPPTGRSIAAD